VKAGLALMGRIADVLRLPLVPATRATRDALRAALATAGANVP
jgi:dihydrodipicolinate synthase/N-acetylneuraminate lyase